MTGIIIATLVVALTGLLIGIALVAIGNKFAVETDEKEAAVRELLPGNNCGACGFAGCDAVAAAIAHGETAVNTCPVASADRIKKIGEVMGVNADAAVRRVAFVKCGGDCNETSEKCNYVGIKDCRAAVLAGISIWECDYGCLGFGSCVQACQFDAISVKDGVASVDTEKCTGCGQCAKACPKGLIEMTRVDKRVAVRCSNKDRGAQVRKVCRVGCIGCKLCEKECEHNAVTVVNNVAQIDYDKCAGCGKCADKCPSHVIMRFHLPQPNPKQV